MRMLCTDSRPSVRLRLVTHVARCHVPLSPDEEDWLIALSDDPDPTVRNAFADALINLLRRAPPLEQTYIVTNWSLSPREGARIAAARAARRLTGLVGTQWTLDRLRHDRSVQVRAAARSIRLT
jgi:hypothetical protein